MKTPIIKAKDLTLRPITLSDAQGYLECHKDKEAQKNFSHCPKNLKEAREEIKKDSTRESRTWVIEVNGEFAGFIHLRGTNVPRYKHSSIMGYGLHPKFRGRGLATKATKLVTSYGFNKLKLVRIAAMCRSYNQASARVLEKAGYKLEGIMKKNKFKDGKYLDDMIWAKVK